jgi:predicted dienelactone hydrolase
MRGKVVGMVVAALAVAATCGTVGGAQTSATPHAVGVVSKTFVDKRRPTAANGDCAKIPSRTLPTMIFYPAVQPNGTPDTTGGPYPLIVFSHGFGATAKSSQALLEYLASRGYVVAAPTFPLSSGASPCGAIAGDVVNQPEDESFVIDSVLKESAGKTGPLAGLVDRNKIGAAGHSNGAVTTYGLVANSKVRDARVDAAVVMAGTLQKYPTGRYDFVHAPPVLLVHGSDDSLVPYDLGVAAYNQLHGPKGLLTITGGNHGSASGPLAYAAAGDFFDAYLRGDSAARARLPNDQVPTASTMQFDAKKGSTATIPTIPRPEQHLKAAVTPSKNLTGGQVVTVTWSGYTPGKVVNILQCNATNRDLSNSAACDYANAKLLVPDPTGEGEAQLTIVEGPVGSGGVCDAQHAGCFVVINNASSSDPRDSVFVDISFKKQ